MKNMKKMLALLLAVLMITTVFVACKKEDAPEVEMNKITAEELEKALDGEEYTIIDLRKTADFEAGHLPGSIPADLTPAVEGDAAKGLETMKKAIEGVDNKIVLVCYTGNKYAIAGTKALKEAGYDMSKVFTLDGGSKNWEKVFPDKIEK